MRRRSSSLLGTSGSWSSRMAKRGDDGVSGNLTAAYQSQRGSWSMSSGRGKSVSGKSALEARPGSRSTSRRRCTQGGVSSPVAIGCSEGSGEGVAGAVIRRASLASHADPMEPDLYMYSCIYRRGADQRGRVRRVRLNVWRSTTWARRASGGSRVARLMRSSESKGAGRRARPPRCQRLPSGYSLLEATEVLLDSSEGRPRST